MKDSITVVGMDVHKNSISIALAETGDSKEVRSYGAIGGTMAALDKFVKKGEITIQILRSNARWFGVTYREDKPFVVESIRKMVDQGMYPEKLF